MDTWMVILRLIHITAGVFWAGSTFFLVSFIAPSVQATGAEGQKFMQQLGLRSGMTNALAGAATLSALSGIIMYILLTDFDSEVMRATYFVILAIGGIAGISGWFVGFFVQNLTTRRMQALAADIAASGGPPSPEQMAEMQALAQRIGLGGRITAVLLTIAVVAMASAQPLASALA